MTYYRQGNRTPRPRLVTGDDVGTFVTIKVRNARGGAAIYASGVVKHVGPTSITLTRTVHPTGPWDKWESHDVDSEIAHSRILSRA